MTYAVWIPGIGEVFKQADSIAEARLWAKRGFPKLACTVARWSNQKRCQCCDCSPCVRAKLRSR